MAKYNLKERPEDFALVERVQVKLASADLPDKQRALIESRIRSATRNGRITCAGRNSLLKFLGEDHNERLQVIKRFTRCLKALIRLRNCRQLQGLPEVNRHILEAISSLNYAEDIYVASQEAQADG